MAEGQWLFRWVPDRLSCGLLASFASLEKSAHGDKKLQRIWANESERNRAKLAQQPLVGEIRSARHESDLDRA